MKFYLAGLALLVAARVWLWTVSADLTAKYAPDYTTAMAFLDAHAIQKLMMLACLMLAAGAVLLTGIGALVAAASKGRPGKDMEIILLLMAAGAVVLGLLGGGYGEMNTRIAIAATHTTNVAVTAPSRIESLLNVEIGLFAGIVALTGAALVHLIASRKRPAAV